MARTQVRQDTQVHGSDVYDDTLPAGATLQTDAASLEADLNGVRTQLRALVARGAPGPSSRWYDPVTAPPELTADEHAALRQLIHLADGGGPFEGWDSGAFREILPLADPFPTNITWWESAAKLKRIVDKTVTYTGVLPTVIRWRSYAADGVAVLATITDSIVYSTVFETGRTRAIT